MTCTGVPFSVVEKVVRRISCRRAISCRLRSKTAGSSAPVIRQQCATLYAVRPGSSRSSTQSRSCANDSAMPPLRSARGIVVAAFSASESCASSSALCATSFDFSSGDRAPVGALKRRLSPSRQSLMSRRRSSSISSVTAHPPRATHPCLRRSMLWQSRQWSASRKSGRRSDPETAGHAAGR